MTVGERLREARRKLKKRQVDIANEVGVKQPAVALWEGGDSGVASKHLAAAAKAYGLDVTDLLPQPPADAGAAEASDVTESDDEGGR